MSRSKKSRKSKKRSPESNGQGVNRSFAENVAYYFLAAIGGLIILLLLFGLLSYLKIL